MTRMISYVATLGLAAVLLHAGCDKQNNPSDDGGGNPVIDLAQGPADLAGSSMDLAGGGGPTMPGCASAAGPTCGTGSTFQSSPTASGCFPNGTTPPGAFTPSFDNPAGTCASVGDKVIKCTGAPNCSFCIKTGAATPPGCTAS
jgi:hypothetical protein